MPLFNDVFPSRIRTFYLDTGPSGTTIKIKNGFKVRSQKYVVCVLLKPVNSFQGKTIDDLHGRLTFNLGKTKFANLYVFALDEEKFTIFATILAQKWYLFPSVIQFYKNLQTLRGYIFHVLQHFATKLANSTNFSMLFLTVVKDFVRLA